MKQKNSALQGAEENKKSGANVNTLAVAKLTKNYRILSALQAGQSLNMFEAERLGDHVLRSTIAGLRREGHSITDEWELVPTRFGRPARVKRYRYVLITARTAEVEDALAPLKAAT